MADMLLGNLVWKISGDTTDFDKNLKEANTKATNFGGSLKKIFNVAIFAGITAGVTKIGKELVGAASKAEETQNKFDVTFRGVSKSANEAASALAKGYGLSSQASKALLSDTGDLLQGFGFAKKESLDLSIQVAKLGTDLASFTNYAGGAEGATQALTRALLGETDGVKALGIAITQEDIKKLAESQGLVFESMTRAEKAMVTYQLAVQQSQNAIGDFARSQNSFANQTRIANANIEEIKTTFGEAFLPIANVGVKMFNSLAGAALSTADNFKAFVTSAEGSEKIANAIGFLAGSFSVIGEIAKTVFPVLKKALEDAFKPLLSVTSTGEKSTIVFDALGVVVQGVAGALAILGKIAGAAVQVIIDLYNVVKSAGTVIGTFWDLLKGEASVKDFKNAIKGTVDSFSTLSNNFFDNIGSIAEETKNQIVGFADGAKNNSKAIQESFSQSFQKIKEDTQAALLNAGEKSTELKDTIIENVREQSQAELDALAKLEEERQKAADKEAARIAKEKKDKEDALNETLEFSFSTVGAFLTGFEGLITNIYDSQNANLEAQTQARLKALGLEEETAVQKAQKEYEAAVQAGDLALADEKKREVEKQKIYADTKRKQALLDYQAAKTAYGMQITNAIISGAMASLNAYQSAAAIPLIGSIMAPIAAATAAAAAAINIATIAANPPRPPAFANGGIVPFVPGLPNYGDAVTARVNPGELILNESQQRNVADKITGQGMVVHFTQNVGMNFDTLENGQRAAQMLFPLLQTEGLRRGSTV